MKEFYLAIKTKVETGNYVLDDMHEELQLAYEKGRITLVQYEELIELANDSINYDYVKDKYPSRYDLDQDNNLTEHDESITELFEMILKFTANTIEIENEETKLNSSIVNSYARLIIKGIKDLSSVPNVIVKEVANKLIEQDKTDLVEEKDDDLEH